MEEARAKLLRTILTITTVAAVYYPNIAGGESQFRQAFLLFSEFVKKIPPLFYKEAPYVNILHTYLGNNGHLIRLFNVLTQDHFGEFYDFMSDFDDLNHTGSLERFSRLMAEAEIL